MRVALVRHPKPLVAEGVCYGRLDLALHPAADMACIPVALADFGPAMIWSSPAQRCRIVASQLGAAQLDDRLLELHFGDWEGVAWDVVPRDQLDVWAADALAFAPPGGESGAALLARVSAFHAELVQIGRDCVVVSHGGPLKILRALLCGDPVDLLAAPPAIGSVTVIGQG